MAKRSGGVHARRASDRDKATSWDMGNDARMEARESTQASGAEFERVVAVQSAGLVIAHADSNIEMARDGLRYGAPGLPRYCTGRSDGRAPRIADTGAGEGQLRAGKQRG